MPSCYKCGKEVVVIERLVGRRDICEACGADLHCCRNCVFYDPHSYNECREPVAERIVDKQASNFCDLYQIADKPYPVADKSSDAKKKLDEMFKKRG